MSDDECWGEPSPMRRFIKPVVKSKKERIAEERKTEENICSFLNSSTEYFHERYVYLDSDGNETYQLIYFDGYKNGFICPDVTMYNDSWNREILMRIEVKRKESNGENSYFYDEFYVETEHFDNYMSVHRIEEIPVRILFVLGETNETKSIWWESIDALDITKKLVRRPFEKSTNGYGKPNLADYYYWNTNILKKLNLKTFYDTDMY